MSVTLDLPGRLVAWMDEEVQRRGLASREALVVEALQHLAQQELKALVAEGIAQADAGKVTPLDDAALDAMQRRGRDRALGRETRGDEERRGASVTPLRCW